MRLNQLKIQNFRCFESETVSFSPQFNLFIGVNGAGKTALLSAIAAAFISTNRLSLPEGQDKNTRLVSVRSGGRIRYEYRYPINLQPDLDCVDSPKFLELSTLGLVGLAQTHIKGVNLIALGIPTNPADQDSHDFPLLAFYKAERHWRLDGILPDQALQQKPSRFDGYQSWDDAALDFKSLESWVITATLEKLESAAAGPLPGDLAGGAECDELDLANQAIHLAIPEAQGLRYDIKQRLLVLDWVDGHSVPVDKLSDGQRGVVALVADIARRMALLNPHLGAQVLAQTPGIVLIDELDIHLHPAWQRRLPQMLKTVFPQIQFIATCHSPQMMGELPASEIWLMKAGQVVGHPERALGLSANQVLEELMDAPARNLEVTAQLAQIDRLLDADDLAQAQPLVAALRAQVGDIPEVIAAQASIDSLRWLDDDAANA